MITGGVGIGWQTYLSLLNQRAVQSEGLEHEREKPEQKVPEEIASKNKIPA